MKDEKDSKIGQALIVLDARSLSNSSSLILARPRWRRKRKSRDEEEEEEELKNSLEVYKFPKSSPGLKTIQEQVKRKQLDVFQDLLYSFDIIHPHSVSPEELTVHHTNYHLYAVDLDLPSSKLNIRKI